MSSPGRDNVAAVIHAWLEEYADAGCELHDRPDRLADCEDLAQRIIDEAT